MRRAGRAFAQALLFAGISVPIAVALSYAEVYLLGHVSDSHTPQWHVSLGISTKVFSLVFAVPIFTLGALLKNSHQRSWSGSLEAAVGGLVYFVPLTAVSMATWARSGALFTVLLVLMFAHIFFSPFFFGRWAGSRGPLATPALGERTRMAG